VLCGEEGSKIGLSEIEAVFDDFYGCIARKLEDIRCEVRSLRRVCEDSFGVERGGKSVGKLERRHGGREKGREKDRKKDGEREKDRSRKRSSRNCAGWSDGLLKLPVGKFEDGLKKEKGQ
jgi:hypothetical protein